MNYRYGNSNNRKKPASHQNRRVSSEARKSSTLPPNQHSLIQEFIEALDEEIEAIKKGRGGSIVNVYDGAFIRQEGPFFVYIFATESPLIVMDDAPAEVEIEGRRFAGQIISVQGSEVAVGIERDFGATITQAKIITNLWYLLEALRNRYEEVLNGERALDTRLGQCLFGFTNADVRSDSTELNLPASAQLVNDEQLTAIRKACGSDIHFIWGPPGTGKTKTIGFLIAALIKRNLRILVVSHTNVATDHAIAGVAKLLLDSEDYQRGRLVRFGNISPTVDLPEMVIPEKIAERLGEQFRQQLLRLQRDLAPIQEEIAVLRIAEATLARQKQLDRDLEGLIDNHRQCLRDHQDARSRETTLLAELETIEAKLIEAQRTGKLGRFFRGLNPAKLHAQLISVKTDLSVVSASIAAGASKLTEFHANIENTQRQQKQTLQELQEVLSRQNVDPQEVSRRVLHLLGQSEELTNEIRAIEAELEALVAKILREAKLVATSLTRATISKQFDYETFDVLVVDEASMAPMPALYFAAGRAANKVIVVGDFRQLPPICVSDTEMAQKWLGRDIFNQTGVQHAIDEGKPEPRLTMLQRQYRMHPDISAISNRVIYRDKLADCLGLDALNALVALQKQSPFAKAPLVLYDLSSTNPWSSRLDQGGRYNLYSAALSAELARRATQAGINVGVISPYAAHARLIKLMLDDSNDHRLRHLKVSTVHRFQGLEQDAIIFDIAEGPMPRFGPSPLVNGSNLGSQAAKLINVSITRPRAQLVVIANLSYLMANLDRHAVLVRVLEQVRHGGIVIDSRQIVEDYFCSDYERWSRLLNPHDDGIDPSDSTLYTERNFYAAFFADLRKAVREIIIVSPFLTASRAQQFFDLLRLKRADGVEVRVFTRTSREQQGDMLRQSDMVFEGLKQIGVQVIERKGLHQKFAFIDRKIAWEGGLNILSQSEGRSTEHMRRLLFAKTCEELIELHKFGSDNEVAPGSRQRIQTDRMCETHGVPMILVPGPFGLFLGCPRYPDCEEKPQTIRRDDRVSTDAKCPGRDGNICGQTMVALRGRYGVYLKCSNSDCGVTRTPRA